MHSRLFEDRNRPVYVDTDASGKPLPTGTKQPVGAGLVAAAPSEPNPPGDGDDDDGDPSTPKSPKGPPRPKSPEQPPSRHATPEPPYKTPPSSLTGRSASWERDPSRHSEAAPPKPVTPKKKPPPPNPYPYPYGKPTAHAPPELDNSWWASQAASSASRAPSEQPKPGRLAPHRPPSGSPPSNTPRSVEPTTRYQPRACLASSLPTSTHLSPPRQGFSRWVSIGTRCSTPCSPSCSWLSTWRGVLPHQREDRPWR